MATTNIGQVSIVPMGAFSLGTTYKRLSVVTYNGSSYIAKVDNVNKPITDSTVWYLLASKGDKGDTYEVTPEDLQAIADQITSDASSAFNQHVATKTSEFDSHVTTKTTQFDNNASTKTTDFNTNATNKTNDFNTNATSKTTDFNTNATTQTTAFNTNAQAKVDYYNQNANALIEISGENLDQIPKKLVEGTTINVTDSSNLPLADIQIKGNASQTTTSIAGGDEYDSPTPDHPQPISVVTGDNTVTLTNQSILDINSFTKNSASFTLENDVLTIQNTNTTYARIQKYIQDLCKANKGKTIKFRCDDWNVVSSDGTSNTQVQVVINYNDGTPTLYRSIYYPTYDGSWTIPTNFSNIDRISVQIYCNNSGTRKDVTLTITKPMFYFVEDNATPVYAPYTEQSQLISLGNIELAKIGDCQDYIYKSEGKWYKYGVIKKATLNGTETWQINTNTSYAYNLFYDEVDFKDYLKVAGSIALSTMFKGGDNSANSGGVYSQGDNIVCFRNNSNDTLKTLYITNNSSSVNDFKALLTNNNATLYYVLATPTITEITDTTLVGQLDSLLALKTNRNITNMFTATDNEEPTLAVLYRQDLTTLFNNLTSAVLSLGNNT